MSDGSNFSLIITTQGRQRPFHYDLIIVISTTHQKYFCRQPKKSLTFEVEPVILYPQSIQTQPEMKKMKTAKSAKSATHRQVANCTVTYTLTKDFLGAKQYKVKFENGETTTLSEKRFNEIFVI
jgi:hypothetical protein